MLDLIGIPLWLGAVPPIAALLCIVLWRTHPQLRRHEAYRLALIASISLTALEAILAAVFLFVLVLFSGSRVE